MSEITAPREPSLEDMFADPIVQLMMRRDGVRIEELQSQLHRAQTRQQPNRPDRQPRF